MGWFASKQEKLNQQFLEACKKGTREEVSLLLSEGADINTQEDGDTGLYLSIRHNKEDIANLLVDRGALLAEGAAEELLRKAAMESSPIVITFFLQRGVDINAKDSAGYTALHWAARCGDFQTVKALVEYGADINIMNDSGEKPLTLAKDSGRNAIVEFLQEKAGPVITAPAATGWTLTAPDKIALIEEDAGYCLTSIFNFSARTYTHLARNLATNVESQTMRFFGECPDKEVLETAWRELVKRGGKADKNVIYGSVIQKG